MWYAWLPGEIKMAIEIVLNKGIFPTKCDVSSMVCLNQDNHCGHNHIVLDIDDIKYIIKAYNKYMAGFK